MAANTQNTAVARIFNTNGKIIGAGVLVSDTHVLTCAHVVNNALGRGRDTFERPPTDTSITFDFPVVAIGVRLRAKIVAWQFEPERTDLAGLELVDPLPAAIQPARLKPIIPPAPVATFGFPKGYNRGVEIPSELTTRVGGNWLQMNTTDPNRRFISGGFSGGPVWASDGSGIIGIIAESDSEEVAYCIPVDMLAEQWDGLTIQPLPNISAAHSKDTNLFCGRELSPLHRYGRLAETTFIIPAHKNIFIKWLQVRAEREAGIGVIPSLKHYHHAHLIVEPSKDAMSEDFGIWRDIWSETSWVRIPFVHISIIPLSNHPEQADCEVCVARLQPYELINKQPAELTIWEIANKDYDSLITDICVRWTNAKTTSYDNRPSEWQAWRGRLPGKPPQERDTHMASQEDSKALIKEKERRLHHLELRKARQGFSVDPSVTIEIEDIKSELENLRSQLK